LGSARPWLEQGQKIAVRNAPTHFGSVSCEIVSDVDHDRIRATVQLPARRPPGAVVLHLRHPAAARIASAQVNGEDWQDIEGEAVRLTGLAGTVTVTATYQESPAGR
jgi:hypothetical protein